jgi:hypothetical protein
MIMNNGNVFISFFLSLLFITGSFFSCTKDIAGAGSETTNSEGITGMVRNSDGSAAAASIVKLLPVDFNATGTETVPEAWIDTTGNNGTYLFSKVENGAYNIIIRHRQTKTACKIDSIQYRGADTLFKAPNGNLAATGNIEVLLDETLTDEKTMVFIPGTDIAVAADDANVLLEDVPAGAFSSIYFTKTGSLPEEISSGTTVSSNETVHISVEPSPRRKILFLNTTETGALLETSLTGFPVLLRLTADNFTFEDSDPEGKDIRFTTADSTDIPFEITFWDATTQQAVVWLLIDTLHADTITELSMYYGNDNASAVSTSSEVFSTTNQFQGVWHLESTGSDTVYDATENGYNGVFVNSGSVAFSEGLIGSGCMFNGTDGYILMPGTASSTLSFPEQGTYTVSAWVYVEEIDNNTHVVVSKGNYHYFLYYTSIHTGTPLWEFSEYQSGTGWELSTADASGGAWHYLTGVREGTRQLLYVNGILADTMSLTFNAIKENDTSYDLVFGRFLQDFGGNDFCFFEGSIDEVRISSTARSSEWIRLCFESQKPDSKVISFAP